MPRFVSLVEGDNRLLIDLDSEIAGELVYDQIDTAKECLSSKRRCPSQIGAGWKAPGDVTQLNLSRRSCGAQRSEPADARDPGLRNATSTIRPRLGVALREVLPGEQAFDDFLRRCLAPQLHDLVRSGCVDRWFFLRYADPQPHLRARLHAAGAYGSEVRDRVMAAAEAWLQEDRVLRYAFDTYDPEYERYGGGDALSAVDNSFTPTAKSVPNNLAARRTARMPGSPRPWNRFSRSLPATI